MSLENNVHLKAVEKILDNWDTVKGNLTTNDEDGVDLVSAIDLSKLGFEEGTDEDEILEALEKHYEGSEYYFEKERYGNKEPALVISSYEEIFVTYEGELHFPDKDSKNIKLSKDDFDRRMEIIVYSLNWMHDGGSFPSIYELDYYGSPTLVNFTEWEEYKALHMEDNKQYKEIQILLSVINLKKSLDETTRTLGELPEEFYKKLPKVLSSNDGNAEIMEISNYDAYSIELSFVCEDFEDDGDTEEFNNLIDKGILTDGADKSWYKIYISIRPQSVQFIMEA